MSPETIIEGPILTVEPLTAYDARLKREVRDTWYHVHKDLRPGAFVRADKDGIPDSDDRMFTYQEIYDRAKAEYQKYIAASHERRVLRMRDLVHLVLLYHEYLHTLVPWEGTVPAVEYKRLSERYGHPNAAWPAIQHAFRNNLPVNAFTRLLRCRLYPMDAWEKFLAWFAADMAKRNVTVSG